MGKNTKIGKSRFQNIRISFVLCRVFDTFPKLVDSSFCDPSDHFLNIFHMVALKLNSQKSLKTANHEEITFDAHDLECAAVQCCHTGTLMAAFALPGRKPWENACAEGGRRNRAAHHSLLKSIGIPCENG